MTRPGDNTASDKEGEIGLEAENVGVGQVLPKSGFQRLELSSALLTVCALVIAVGIVGLAVVVAHRQKRKRQLKASYFLNRINEISRGVMYLSKLKENLSLGNHYSSYSKWLKIVIIIPLYILHQKSHYTRP